MDHVNDVRSLIPIGYLLLTFGGGNRIKTQKEGSGAYSRICPGGTLNFFLIRGSSAPVETLKPPEIHRFPRYRGD